MNNVSFSRLRLPILCGVVVLLLDQFCKYLAISFLDEKGVFFLKNVFGLFYERSTAYAGLASLPSFVVYVGFIVCVVSAVFFIKEKLSQPIVFGFVLMFAGAFGNIIDRLLYDTVIDWIVVKNLFVFNIADVAILSGIAIVLFEIIFFKRDSYT